MSSEFIVTFSFSRLQKAIHADRLTPNPMNKKGGKSQNKIRKQNLKQM